MIVVLTGVSGAGKSTVGKELAERLGWDFFDADHFHPDENIERMSSGVALTDEDRQPWLETLKALIDARLRLDADAVLACSALKTAYRNMLGAQNAQVKFVLLDLDVSDLSERLQNRKDHFMDARLLGSQVQTLEVDDALVVIDASKPPDEVVADVITTLGLGASNTESS